MKKVDQVQYVLLSFIMAVRIDLLCSAKIFGEKIRAVTS